MTEYAGKSNEEELASAFIVNTCQVLPKSFPVPYDHMHNVLGSSSPAPTPYSGYSISCGSAVEFYIRPLNTCIDDIDYLIARANELVFSGDFPVLPSDMSGLADTIQCYKIEPYDLYPGFVRLRLLGKMNYNWKYKKYEFNETALTNYYVMMNMDTVANDFSLCTLGRSVLPKIVSGPAIKHRKDWHTGLFSRK